LKSDQQMLIIFLSVLFHIDRKQIIETKLIARILQIQTKILFNFSIFSLILNQKSISHGLVVQVHKNHE